MSQNPTESGQVVQGVSELPKPKYREESVAEPTSAAQGLDVDKLKVDLVEAFKPMVETMVKSQQDKRFNKIERQWGDLSELESYLAAVKDGASVDDIMKAVEIQELSRKVNKLEEEKATQNQNLSIGNREAEDAYNRVRNIVTMAGLQNDPQVLAMMAGEYNSPGEMLATVSEYVIQRRSGQPVPNVGEVVTRVPGAPEPEFGLEELTQEYIDKYIDALESGNSAKAENIKQEYKNKGVNVYGISFEYRD